MKNALKFFIDGEWVDPAVPATIDVVDPAIEEAFATISAGSAADVDRAVAAARRAFPSYSRTTPAERLELIKRILVIYERRFEEFAQVMCREVGTPIRDARATQAFLGPAHLKKLIEVLESYEFEHLAGTTMVVREPIGVCGLITPWNVPINQIVTKVGPALAAGCTMVLKPSEVAPLNAVLFAEVLEEAGVPRGVFNLVNGDGPNVGAAISAHPDIDMVSFTGSTRAGIAIAKAAADTVKRVAQELGGKSANILLDDADFEAAVAKGVRSCFSNSGQACSSPTRMLVPEGRLAEVRAIARATALQVRVGSPQRDDVDMGPVVNKAQYEKIQEMIASGIEEGAELLVGGLGRPEGLERGHYVQPTIFAGVRSDMRIAREEIFGPVLSVMTYRDEDEAVEIANSTIYGLAGYVQSGSVDHARSVARRIRAGRVHINYPDMDRLAPFGGYKQSGNGRENGKYGLEEFTELKALIGYGAE
ncbi:aldehyde dehydrogenase family protein [Aquamicrobium sp. LC103]|uniref:aldehyde dehydrogenase family protein n=1 Tax=Aquamicrobium sp. LC103 TaxID=1120658 RepID=UPI00063ECEB0|nr:aldehyde dehydrogenase family protein [Aquamicrobium sp. LC103]TKT74588.1 aldehyde dehydrogenase family protein [Aquamicrobium sp. LC103]